MKLAAAVFTLAGLSLTTMWVQGTLPMPSSNYNINQDAELNQLYHDLYNGFGSTDEASTPTLSKSQYQTQPSSLVNPFNPIQDPDLYRLFEQAKLGVTKRPSGLSSASSLSQTNASPKNPFDPINESQLHELFQTAQGNLGNTNQLSQPTQPLSSDILSNDPDAYIGSYGQDSLMPQSPTLPYSSNAASYQLPPALSAGY